MLQQQTGFYKIRPDTQRKNVLVSILLCGGVYGTLIMRYTQQLSNHCKHTALQKFKPSPIKCQLSAAGR